jgi:hypothetical protein
MLRDEIIDTLRAREGELRAAGIMHVAIFGSVARGAERPESDIDLLAQFDDELSLLDIVRLKEDLTALLGRPVDLIEERALKDRARMTSRADRVDAF